MITNIPRVACAVSGARALLVCRPGTLRSVSCLPVHRSAGLRSAATHLQSLAKSTAGETAAMVQLPGKGKLKGALYDIDGTLVNSDPLHYLAWRELLLEKNYNDGKPITEEWFTDKLSGGHNPEAVAMLFPGISDEDNADIADDKEARFRKLAEKKGLKANEGLSEWLEWADAQGLKKAAVTNAPRLNMEAMLKALGLLDKFDAIVVGEECARAKPHPDPYLDAAKLIGLGLDEVFAVEDSPSGVQAAVAGEIPVIALTVGHPRAKLEKAGATHIVDNWFELADLIKKTQD